MLTEKTADRSSLDELIKSLESVRRIWSGHRHLPDSDPSFVPTALLIISSTTRCCMSTM